MLMITSITRFIAAFFALVVVACLGSNSPCVSSDSLCSISAFSNCDVYVIICSCIMDVSIPCVFVSRLALVAVVLTTLFVFRLLNNTSFVED